MNIWKSLWIFVLAGFLAGCAKQAAELPFTASDLSGKLGHGYRQKVDNALIILDASSSMYDLEAGQQKYIRAKNVVLHMNGTLPPMKLMAGLRVFGPTGEGNSEDSRLVYGISQHNTADLAAAIKAVTVGGLTPLAKPLYQSADDLQNSKGNIAVIIVSDGLGTDGKSPVPPAENLKKAFGDKICIYTILIGSSAEGKKVLEEIAAAGQCGFATTERNLATSEGMADFVEQVFFEKEPVAAKPAPIQVPEKDKTVTINLKVLFDFDKDEVLPREQDELDEFAAYMKENPQTTAVLEGHTDNFGSEAYNERLSLRRAKSVKKYLVKKFNIDSTRLITKGYGFSRPIASNKTEQGRQENRRVVAVISANAKK
ncbi:MAG: OmpA family protein [Deltaproteobacteria bacterium]|nr:OmpA family protein [Deltaproteobacteria bacterium]